MLLHWMWYGRLPQFLLGMVVGEGCLHVRLSAAEARALGRAVDAIALVTLALAFAPGGGGDGNLLSEGNTLAQVGCVCAGVARSRNARRRGRAGGEEPRHALMRPPPEPRRALM